MDEAKYRTELIHTAATALSALEDLAVGKAGSSPAAQALLVEAILEERHRQDRQWGQIHHTPREWVLIIMEEVGEASRGSDWPGFSQPSSRRSAQRSRSRRCLRSLVAKKKLEAANELEEQWHEFSP